MMGLRGGKLADHKGNSFVVYTASGLLLICFIMLSTFAGISPAVIAVLLIFGNVGQTFMQIALSNTISRSLTKDQTGVGMGFMAMLNFLAVATSSAIFSKTLDRGGLVHWNPLNFHQGALVYSNIYLMLAILTVVVAGVCVFKGFRVNKESTVGL